MLLRLIRRMDFSFGDTLVPNVGGLRQYFRHDPYFGYVVMHFDDF